MGWPKSLRWRYSLRALFVFVTFFMIWGGYHANRGWTRRTTEAVLRKYGADYSFTDARTPSHLRGRLEEGYTTLIYCLWGDAYFEGISVTSPLEQEVIEALVALPQLKSLSLQSRRTTAEESVRMFRQGDYGPRRRMPQAALQRLLSQQRIRSLSLASWDLSDNDCHAIVEHAQLVALTLHNCHLSEEGFASLLTVPTLQSLRTEHCNVTGEKLVSRPPSESLNTIISYGEPLGKDFATFVGRSPKVSVLRVSGITIDDDFVTRLGAHPSLRSLELRGTVTDRTTTTLSHIPGLHFVYLPPTVSDESIARLKQLSPDLVIQQDRR